MSAWRSRPGARAYRHTTTWVLAASLAACTMFVVRADAPGVTWRIDSLDRVGGHAVTLEGAPVVVDDEAGAAVAFDGAADGIFLDTNPLEGLEAFTVEVVFAPAADGLPEQRFLHFEEHGGERRVLIETRLAPDGRWALDTFLRDGDARLTLLDRSALHAPDAWHAVALTYDGATMAHYVNARRELAGPVRFRPMVAGRTSIGVRQNKVHWFKGRIHTVRVTPRALTPAEMLTAPGR